MLLQFLIPETVRLVSVFAEPLAALALVGLEVAVTPNNLALALKRQDVGRKPIKEPAIVAHHHCAARKIGDRLF